MKILATALLLTIAATPVLAGESAGLMLAAGLSRHNCRRWLGAGARHVAVRGNGDVYVSTRKPRVNAASVGVIALKSTRITRSVETSISGCRRRHRHAPLQGRAVCRVQDRALSLQIQGQRTGAAAAPEVIVSDLPTGAYQYRHRLRRQGRPVCGRWRARAISAPIPTCPRTRSRWASSPARHVNGRAGMWRFDAEKTNQKFPADGEQIATGVRDMMAVDWSPELKGVYGVMQGRNGTATLADAVANGARCRHDRRRDASHRQGRRSGLALHLL